MPIEVNEQGWVLTTHRTAYAFGINQAGLLTHRYWGVRLPRLDDYPVAPSYAEKVSFYEPLTLTPEEYPPYGGARFVDPCLKVSFADGVRDVVLRFESFDVREGDVPELLIHLRDTFYPFRVTLHYRVHAAYDLVERLVTVQNDGDTPITLERIWSAQWHLPAHENYRLMHVTGRWYDEMYLRREPLVQGIKVLESRRLTTSHHHNPWFAVDDGSARESSGAVYFGLLAWSGNWKLSAEMTDFGSTRVNIGLNDWDFAWRLAPGDTFATPSSFAGYSDGGFGRASRSLHDFIRDTILPHRPVVHKVLYNSWEATEFAVDERSQIELARHAAKMGIELFVLDDGWFHGRNDDTAGLGDWWPDERKFPHGLGTLIAQVNALGMDFGLWVEPEMVNPNSDLYRTHPDWGIHFPTRARTTARNQLILNFGRTDVQEYIIAQLNRLLSENRIAFIKWDMNRNVSEPGWPDAPGDPRELWVRHVEGLYHVWSTLRERHPDVIWQSCSGGGGRADLAILRLADQVWVSDNTDAAARLAIQEGYSHIFPANTMEAWVTDVGRERLSLAFRFHVSMCGSLGVGGHLLHWTPEQRTEAAHWIALYKEIRHIIQFGDQYRLRSPQEHPFSAVQYVSKDRSEGVLFAFRTHMPPPAPVGPLYLRGLDPEAQYEIEGLDGIRSGLAWMHVGLQLVLKDFDSTVRRIWRR
ncbi:MAG: alpha-galactosidase [Herpetosiphonaceae bacterium]|nr:alpha-galactosidase [Herpetosiphonaceae bacterium]